MGAYKASYFESFNCGGQGGTKGCEGLTKKGDKVDGVLCTSLVIYHFISSTPS